MKKFILKTFIFLLPLIIPGIAMEFLLRQIPNDYEYKKNYLDRNSNQIEVLFLGDSHAFFGLNPVYCTTASFNASHVSQSLNYDLRILKKYEHSWDRLRVVFIPISYFSFFESVESGSESWRIKNYIIYYGIKTSKALKDHSEILSSKLTNNLGRLVSYYIKGNTEISCSALGWGISYKSRYAEDLDQTGKEAAKRHTAKDLRYYSENVVTLKSIIEFGKRHNINIVLFTPPAYKTYVCNLRKDQLNKSIQTAESVSMHTTNCSYFNFLEDKSFSESDFYDADHLNEIGAEKFTQLINKLIIEKADSTKKQNRLSIK
jgi:hypothetical protein